MKICIPVKEDKGTDSLVYGHFGSAPLFYIYDDSSESGSILDNSNNEHDHGSCTPVSMLQDASVDIIITAGMGMRAISRLGEAGVKVYRIVSEQTVKDVIESIKKNTLEELTAEHACGHHNGCH